MSKHSLYLFVILILSINIQWLACAVPKKGKIALADVKKCDTTNVAIDPQIAREFPHIDSLLRSWVLDRDAIFQLPRFSTFFASAKTRLFFSMSVFSYDTSAISYGAKIDANGVFGDTIFLNKTFFNKASREFLASVVIHESIHAYITWSCLSYRSRRNGVDVTYLKKNFHSDWLRMTSQSFPDNDEEHALMTKDFIKVMFQSLYPFTNRRSTPILREAVAGSLTWGGLLGTPKWKELMVDTCYFRNVDIWARNMDADSMKGVG